MRSDFTVVSHKVEGSKTVATKSQSSTSLKESEIGTVTKPTAGIECRYNTTSGE